MPFFFTEKLSAMKKTYKRIDSFLSFKFFDRKARAYWQSKWKLKTGSLTARGWNRSDEFLSYRNSIKPRVIAYAERNPTQFFDKVEYILKYANLTFDQIYSYGGKAGTVMAFLNPMRGKWGLSNLISQLELKAKLASKRLILIAKVEELTGYELINNQPAIVRSITESDHLRGEIMSNYGINVAMDKSSGTYDVIGANYRVRTIASTTDMLALVEMEIFAY